VSRFLLAGLPEPYAHLAHEVLLSLESGATVTRADSLNSLTLGLSADAASQLLLAHVDLLVALPAGVPLPAVIVLAPDSRAIAALEIAERLAADLVLWPAASDEVFAGQLRHACRTGLGRAQLARAAADRLNLLQVQQTLIRGAAAGGDLAAILQLAVGLIHRRLGHPLVAAYLSEPESRALALCAVAGAPVDRITTAAYHVKVGQGVAGRAVEAGQALQWSRAAQPDDVPIQLDGVQMEAALGLPICAGARCLGALVVGTSRPAAFTTEQELELGALAEQLATIILSLESAQREAEQAGRERLLTHISHVANSWLNPGEMLHQAIDAVARSLRADRSALSLFDWEEGVFVTDHEHTNPMLTERRSLRRRAPLVGGLAQVAAALKTGQILVSTEGRVHPALQEYWAWLVERHGVRSVIWVPVPDQSSGRLYSFSLMQVTHARQWGEADVALLAGIADQLALALRNAELFDGMRQAAVQLESKNSELEAFVYTVSHDLQAPVVSLRGFASLLETRYHDVLDDRGRSYLTRIAANAEYLGRLLQDLLELSRVGRREEPDEHLAVQSVLDEVLLDLTQTFTEHHVVLDLPAEWPIVRYSRTRLRQVFSNLLTNAVKFMGPQPRPHIQVGWQPGGAETSPDTARLPSGSAGAYVEFFVKDNGIGIHPDYHQLIFVPFERLKQVDVAGTGVGLSIVKRIIEGRGGQIRLESQPGVGTTFFFTLPAVREAAPLPAEGVMEL
jgi:signal transduction histidine kinase/putative methionine-R-sulfoxide reductase with GAF domain